MVNSFGNRGNRVPSHHSDKRVPTLNAFPLSGCHIRTPLLLLTMWSPFPPLGNSIPVLRMVKDPSLPAGNKDPFLLSVDRTIPYILLITLLLLSSSW
jgi:hypothetical protein